MNWNLLLKPSGYNHNFHRNVRPSGALNQPLLSMDHPNNNMVIMQFVFVHLLAIVQSFSVLLIKLC